MASQNTTTASATGVSLPCPRCGEAQATMMLDMSSKEFTCQECNEVFHVDEMRDVVARWTRIIGWVDLMPGSDE